MPAKMERDLKRRARSLHFKRGSKRYNRYVFGTMEKRGLLHHKRRKRSK